MRHGLLLVRGKREHVIAWVRRGTVPCYVATDGLWWAIVPAGPSRASAPYTDAMSMLAARPLAHRLRPGIGLMTVDGHAVVAVQGSGWRRPTAWLGWTQGVGRHPMPGLPVLSAADLVAASGQRSATTAHDVRALLGDPAGRAPEVLRELAAVLDLPFAQVCDGASGSTLPGAELVGPSERAVEGFDKVVGEERRLEHEVEEGL